MSVHEMPPDDSGYLDAVTNGTGTGDTAQFVSWKAMGLDTNKAGPYPTEANALRILTRHPRYAGKIWLDEFAQKLMLETADGPRMFSRTDAISLLIWIQADLSISKMSLTAVERAALVAGTMNARHPLREWLKALRWDGTERLPTLMADGFGAEPSAYSSAVGRCWFVSMVARVMKPGCQADYMPVFEGAQGIRKSTAMRIIGGDYFSESSEDPINGRKDFLLALQGKWLIEIPEMHAIASRFTGIEKIKAIISIRTDSYRVPYGATTMDYPRQCIFAGTTNADEWNADSTGGRRFWPIRCGQVNTEYLTEQRSQLFAEAMARFTAGECWHDVPQTEAMEQQEARRQRDEWEALIEHFVTHHPNRSNPPKVYWEERPEPLSQVTIADILGEALAIKEGGWDRLAQMRVASALVALHWKRSRVTLDGKRAWVYIKHQKTTEEDLK